jgi:hypothetical protein
VAAGRERGFGRLRAVLRRHAPVGAGASESRSVSTPRGWPGSAADRASSRSRHGSVS